MSETYAAWFRRTRESRGLNIEQTAQELKLKASTISRWEDGSLPRSDLLGRIQRWSKIKAAELLRILET